jgi:hypothetical protein
MTKVASKKLVCGVGINDADYFVSHKVNGKAVICPYYDSWKSMLRRCYSKDSYKVCPTYMGCTVTVEWLTFSNFKSWMEKQEWHGKQIDKDILFQNNKVYCELACIFVTPQINKLLNSRSKLRGIYPIGVTLVLKTGRYKAQCQAHGKKKHIGVYNTPEEAHEAYKKFKYKHIAEIANQQSEPLRTALLNYKIEG